jgi:trehalose 6-phosphate synthase
MLAYRKANKIFADTIMPHLEDGGHIWVHDYHLMLLPLMIRQRAEQMHINVTIGWFLHTPFPSYDFLDVLPGRKDILDGILGADLVGFQTDQARGNFLTACSQALYVQPYRHGRRNNVLTISRKWWSTDTGILCGVREVSVQTFPIGIEPSEFHFRLKKHSVQDTIRKMRADLGDTKVILGVDRLDCIKGIPQKLHAFDTLLERRPDIIGGVTLLQVAVPSRDDLKSHQDLKEEIQHLVGEINGKYGPFTFLI